MGFYHRRHPERSDYYRLLESGFEAFARNWPEDFETRYGFLRKEVQGAVFAFLECGIPENGVARVRCPGCGHDFFVAFSCRTRVVCPSCTTRRSLMFGEKVREIVHPLNHRHLSFTIPKLLRAYLRRNRRLGKLLLRSAWQAWQEYLRKRLRIRAGMSGGIFCLQTHGSLFNFHPHVHALVLPGLVREGRFHELKGCSATAVAVSFRSRFLNALQKQEVLDSDMVERLMSWDHNSGFNVHAGKPINGADGEAIERQARYMSRAPLSIERIHYHADDHSVTVDGGKSHAGSRNWSVPEFFALLAAHTPCRYESLVTYYGVYSSSHRGKCKRENREERVEEIVVEAVPVSSAARQPSNWAKWIRNIYETDPLTCSECGESMRIIAFITDSHEVAKILKHIGEQTSRAPPLTPTDPVPSSCDFDDTNCRHAEVSWYPDPPALDF